jgi:hypothetical protein
MSFPGALGTVLMRRKAAVAGASWTPASLTSLKGWYVADQQTEGNGNPVASFVDRSGNGNHFSQATALAKPTLRTNVLNGKKGLQFDGTLNELDCATGLLNGAAAAYFFAVIKLDNDPPPGGTGHEGAVLDGFSTSGSNCHHPFTDGHIYDGFGSTVRSDCGDPAASLAAPAMLAAISGAGDYRCLVNNGTQFSTGVNAVGLGTATRIMGRNGGSAYLSGYIFEVLIGNAVPTAGEIANIRAYLNSQYATSF